MSEETAWPAARRHATAGMVRRAAASTRCCMIVAVLGCFLGSVARLVYGAIAAVQTLVDAIVARAGADTTMTALILAFIEMLDAFLLGAVLYIVALGLYQLVIDDGLPLPRWLAIGDLDDLKAKVIGMSSCWACSSSASHRVGRPAGHPGARGRRQPGHGGADLHVLPGPSASPRPGRGHRAGARSPGRAAPSAGQPSVGGAWAVSGPVRPMARGAGGTKLGCDGDDPAARARSAPEPARGRTFRRRHEACGGATAKEEIDMADYTLVVGAFRDPDDADQALPSVQQAAKDQGLKVHDAGIVRRSADGVVEIKETGDWGFWKGAIAGGVVTGAIAVIAGPVGWGLLAAGVAGGVIAKVHDANIQDDALYRLGARAKQAASALVIMVDPAGAAAIAAALTAAGAAATTVGLDEATATRLADAAGAGRGRRRQATRRAPAGQAQPSRAGEHRRPAAVGADRRRVERSSVIGGRRARRPPGAPRGPGPSSSTRRPRTRARSSTPLRGPPRARRRPPTSPLGRRSGGPRAIASRRR